MRVLPIWQPWASLVAVGAKRVETRHWAAPNLIGQRIAIYATKKKKSELHLVRSSPFADRLIGELARLDETCRSARSWQRRCSTAARR